MNLVLFTLFASVLAGSQIVSDFGTSPRGTLYFHTSTRPIIYSKGPYTYLHGPADVENLLIGFSSTSGFFFLNIFFRFLAMYRIQNPSMTVEFLSTVQSSITWTGFYYCGDDLLGAGSTFALYFHFFYTVIVDIGGSFYSYFFNTTSNTWVVISSATVINRYSMGPYGCYLTNSATNAMYWDSINDVLVNVTVKMPTCTSGCPVSKRKKFID